MSDSVRHHRWQPTRLPCPWDSPGKNTGVGCHFLLQCMKVKTESEVAQLCRTLSNPMDCSLPGSSVHGIFQARVLECGAIAFSSPKTRADPQTLFFKSHISKAIFSLELKWACCSCIYNPCLNSSKALLRFIISTINISVRILKDKDSLKKHNHNVTIISYKVKNSSLTFLKMAKNFPQ